MPVILPTRSITELHANQSEAWYMPQAELQHIRLLAEAMQIKAKGEPTIPLAEVKRRIAAKKTTSDSSTNRI
ncbi:MAG: hypothetical protein U0350_32045 [Caldilineaceae bacterium]